MADDPNRKWTRALSVISLIAVMTYLLVGASREFGPFAPLPINPTILNTAAAFVGAMAVFVTRGLPEARQMALLGVVALSPIVLYGLLLVTFWTALADIALLDYFLLAAGQRMLVYSMTMGALSLFSMMAALMVLAFTSS